MKIKKHIFHTLVLFSLVFNNMLGAGILFFNSDSFLPKHGFVFALVLIGLIFYMYARAVVRLFDKPYLKYGFTSLIGLHFGIYMGYLVTIIYSLMILFGILSFLNIILTYLSFLYPVLSNLEYRFIVAMSIIAFMVLILLSYRLTFWALILFAGIKILWLGFFNFSSLDFIQSQTLPIYLQQSSMQYFIYWVLWGFIGMESVLWFSHYHINKNHVRLIVWGNVFIMVVLLLLTLVFILIGLHFRVYSYDIIGYVDSARTIFGAWAYPVFLGFIVFYFLGSILSWMFTFMCVLSKTLKFWIPKWPLYMRALIPVFGLALLSIFGIYNSFISFKMDLFYWDFQLISWVVILLIYRFLSTTNFLYTSLGFGITLLFGYFAFWGVPSVSWFLLILNVVPLFFILHTNQYSVKL